MKKVLTLAVLAFGLISTINAQNLIRNPGFESGAKKWEMKNKNTKIITEGVHKGLKSLQFVHSGNGGKNLVIAQKIRGFADKTKYKLTIWMKSEGFDKSSISGVNFSLLCYPKQKKRLYSAWFKPTEKWTQFTFEFTLPEGENAARLYIKCRSKKKTTILIDDLTINEVQ